VGIDTNRNVFGGEKTSESGSDLKHVVRFLLGRIEDCRGDLYTLIIPESLSIAREKREKKEYSENILSSEKLIFNQKLIWAG